MNEVSLNYTKPINIRKWDNYAEEKNRLKLKALIFLKIIDLLIYSGKVKYIQFLE